jgi:hypothetical protein
LAYAEPSATSPSWNTDPGAGFSAKPTRASGSAAWRATGRFPIKSLERRGRGRHAPAQDQPLLAFPEPPRISARRQGANNADHCGSRPAQRWNFAVRERWRVFVDGGTDILPSGSPGFVLPWPGVGFSFFRAGALGQALRVQCVVLAGAEFRIRSCDLGLRRRQPASALERARRVSQSAAYLWAMSRD